MKARFTSVAERELKEAMEFYEAARAGLGAEFLTEVETTTRLIEAHPQAWTTLSPRTRRCRTHRFPYGLFYQVRGEEILIVSVMDLRVVVQTSNVPRRREGGEGGKCSEKLRFLRPFAGNIFDSVSKRATTDMRRDPK